MRLTFKTEPQPAKVSMCWPAITRIWGDPTDVFHRRETGVRMDNVPDASLCGVPLIAPPLTATIPDEPSATTPTNIYEWAKALGVDVHIRYNSSGTSNELDVCGHFMTRRSGGTVVMHSPQHKAKVELSWDSDTRTALLCGIEAMNKLMSLKASAAAKLKEQSRDEA